jgi:hypothetical protein
MGKFEGPVPQQCESRVAVRPDVYREVRPSARECGQARRPALQNAKSLVAEEPVGRDGLER